MIFIPLAEKSLTGTAIGGCVPSFHLFSAFSLEQTYLQCFRFQLQILGDWTAHFFLLFQENKESIDAMADVAQLVEL